MLCVSCFMKKMRPEPENNILFNRFPHLVLLSLVEIRPKNTNLKHHVAHSANIRQTQIHAQPEQQKKKKRKNNAHLITMYRDREWKKLFASSYVII